MPDPCSHVTISKRVTLTADARHRLQAWVSETSNNIPPTIFVYQRIPLVPLDTGLSDLFVHVASYADTVDFPENEPAADSPYYRRYYIDLLFDSLATLEEKWTWMRRQIKLLVEDIVRVNTLPPVDIQELDL